MRAPRPNWAHHDFLGQEVGAFADFLIWGLQAHPRLRNRAVAVYNGTNGTCEIFRSFHHVDRHAPVIALWFEPPAGESLGHYQLLQFDPRQPSLLQLARLHRRGPADGPAIPTITTDAQG